MKKWREYSASEKRMLVVLGILILLILLTFGRVSQGVQKGMSRFFSDSADTVQVLSLIHISEPTRH